MTGSAITDTSISQQRLQYFPISMFAIVMGLAGLTIAWKAVATLWAPEWIIWQYLAWMVIAVFLFIAIFYLIKSLRYPVAVKDEFKHPIKLNFFPTISISLLLFSIIWLDKSQVARALWMTGTAIQLPLTLFVLSHWIYQPHYTQAHVNPSWFIPVVGNIIVPITGTTLGYTEISWFFFSVGLLFWLILLTIVMHRLFFTEALPAKLTPTLFILMAPPAVGFISYLSLNHGLDNFARMLFYVTLFFVLLLIMNAMRFFRLPFFISSWAYTFPLAAATTASVKMAHYLPGAMINIIIVGLFLTLNLIILWLLYKTVLAIRAGAICQPE